MEALQVTPTRALRASLLVVALLALAACRDTTEPTRSPVARLALAAVPDTLGLGDTLLLAAEALDSAGVPVRGVTIRWSSSAPARVAVSTEGRLRALLVGDAWLVARASIDGREVARDSVRTHAARLPRGLVLVAPRDSVILGDTLTLVATVVDGLGAPFDGYPVRYRSNDTVGVQVDSLTGAARVIADGDTRVWATADGVVGSMVLRAYLPQLQTGGVRLAQIDLGWNFGCGLDAVGTAYCWGNNASGQLGRGTSSPEFSSSFGAVSTATRYASIGAGRGTACAVTTDGAAECWGSSVDGWVPSATQRSLPNRVPLPDTAATVRSVHVGDDGGHCLLDTGGINYCWGDNTYGTVGARDSVGERVAIPRPLPATPGSFRSIHLGEGQGCGVRFGMGAVYCWGQNWTTDSTAPDHVGLPQAVTGVPPMREVAVGTLAACARDTDDATWCWGIVGGVRRAPARVAGPAFTRIEASVSNACGLTSEGVMHCWMLDVDGIGIVSRSVAPRPFSRRLRFVDMAVGPHAACGLTATGDTYCVAGTPRFGFH
jgi:alpha-tubulin suppressor-like RCC1 family protein